MLARSKKRGANGPRYMQRLHALAVSNGAEKPGSPVDIEASVKGTGAGSVDGRVPIPCASCRAPACCSLTERCIYGTRGAIVWLIETKVWNEYASTKASVLRAYDATNVARELFNREQNSARDHAGVTVRFTIPTIANGRVYIGAKGDVDVYGLITSPSK